MKAPSLIHAQRTKRVTTPAIVSSTQADGTMDTNGANSF
jgi:hypothetical protein